MSTRAAARLQTSSVEMMWLGAGQSLPPAALKATNSAEQTVAVRTVPAALAGSGDGDGDGAAVGIDDPGGD